MSTYSLAAQKWCQHAVVIDYADWNSALWGLPKAKIATPFSLLLRQYTNSEYGNGGLTKATFEPPFSLLLRKYTNFELLIKNLLKNYKNVKLF